MATNRGTDVHNSITGTVTDSFIQTGDIHGDISFTSSDDAAHGGTFDGPIVTRNGVVVIQANKHGGVHWTSH